MNLYLRLVVSALCLSAPFPAGAEPGKPQYVLISFDGAKDNALWARSMAFGERIDARFTYFLSCTNLLAPENRQEYRGPHVRAGRSNIGFGDSAEDVAERLGNVWRAHNRGHEIASHGCGHFDGKHWSAADWSREFAEFSRLTREAWEINGQEKPAGWTSMVDGISGFRAPYLSAGPALDDALVETGLDYDASAVSRGPATPHSENGLMRFALPLVPEGPNGRRIIAMDYNLFVRHSGGIERASEAAAFAERSYRAFRNAFDREYRGKRIPLQIGLHFTLMNGGAYWDAMERFAAEVCGLEDVRCITYREAAKAFVPKDDVTASTPRG